MWPFDGGILGRVCAYCGAFGPQHDWRRSKASGEVVWLCCRLHARRWLHRLKLRRQRGSVRHLAVERRRAVERGRIAEGLALEALKEAGADVVFLEELRTHIGVSPMESAPYDVLGLFPGSASPCEVEVKSCVAGDGESRGQALRTLRRDALLGKCNLGALVALGEHGKGAVKWFPPLEAWKAGLRLKDVVFAWPRRRVRRRPGGEPAGSLGV